MLSRESESSQADIRAGQSDLLERLDTLGGSLVIANRYLRLIAILLFILLGVAVVALLAALL